MKNFAFVSGCHESVRGQTSGRDSKQNGREKWRGLWHECQSGCCQSYPGITCSIWWGVFYKKNHKYTVNVLITAGSYLSGFAFLVQSAGTKFLWIAIP